MKKARHFLLAGLACTILLILSITLGLHLVLPFESIWAEVGFVCVLGLGATLFTVQGLMMILERHMNKF
jgi:hypothetical protein